MMLTNDRERKICEKYSARDEQGFVHCKECPLVKDVAHILCKANSHYDRKRREWVYDLEMEEMVEVEMISVHGKYMGKFPSISEASRKTGINIGNISSCCNGERPTAGGYVFRKVGGAE